LIATLTLNEQIVYISLGSQFVLVNIPLVAINTLTNVTLTIPLNDLGFFRAIEIKVNDKFNLYDLVMFNTN